MNSANRARRRTGNDLRVLLDDGVLGGPPAALRGTRELLERKDGRLVCRVTVYFPPDTAHWLREFCRTRDLQLSDVVTHSILRLRRSLQTDAAVEDR